MSSDFVQLTDAELQEMDLASLQDYASTVSTVIGQEFSTIAAAQAIQNQYDYMILTSQSTINGLGYELTANTNLMIAADVRSNLLVASNASLDSTIALYNSSIVGQNSIIESANLQISSLTLESSDIASKLVQSDIDFRSSAVYYSSLYTTFMGKDLLYQKCVADITATSTLLETAKTAERVSYANWQTSSAYTVARSSELSALYLASNAIQSSITQYKIDEIRATANLTSTQSGIVAISSLYNTSLINQQYYQSLSTQGGVLELYTAAYSTFQTATTLSNAAPTNSVVVAAATMAQQRLSLLTIAKKEIADQTTALQALVAGAITDTYETQLKCAEDAVQLEIQNVSVFQGYANSSIAAVTYFSSLYEQASKDITSSLTGVAKYSTIYESSIAGSNALMVLAAADSASIAYQQAQVDAISLAISSLTIDYTGYTSTYNGWITYSTSMNREVVAAKADLIMYSTLYESTNTAIDTMITKKTTVDTAITQNNTLIKTQSTILQAETINMLAYKTQIDASFNMEESAVFQYRETYVRQKRQEAQQFYDGCVLQEVQATSTQNGNLKIQSAGTTFTPVPININTAPINNAYSILTNISAFLNSFTTIYSNYATQISNLQNISTSIGDQRVSFTTVTSAVNAFAINPAAGQTFLNAQTDFISKQDKTVQLQGNVALTQSQINTAKTSFLTTYNQTFMSNEIIANEATISSFLIKGFNSAIIV